MHFPIVIIWSPTATLPLTLVAVNVNLMRDLAEFIRPLKTNHATVYHVKFKHLDKSEHFLDHFLDIRGCQSFVESHYDSHGCFMGLTAAGCMAVTKQRECFISE